MDAHCAKCGSQRIIPLVCVMKHGLMAHVGFTNPEARMFKGPVFAHFRATICGECGHTELTAENPGGLPQRSPRISG
jgi:hypothetical protein